MPRIRHQVRFTEQSLEYAETEAPQSIGFFQRILSISRSSCEGFRYIPEPMVMLL